MTEHRLSNFDLHLDSRGVMTAILNVPNSSVNVFNAGVLTDLHELVTQLEQRNDVQAVVFRSGKESGFLAGADVRQIEQLQTPEEARQGSQVGQALFTQLEELPIPTIAVIQGPCLGGGLEFAMACKFRIVVNDPRTKLGLPEVELGLLPGWGGNFRLPHLIGLSQALPMILASKKLGAKQAVDKGLAHLLVEPAELDAMLQSFLTDVLDGKRPAHRKRTWKSWFLDQTPIGRSLVFREAKRGIGSKAKHYPALSAILDTVAAGLNKSRDEAFGAERKAFGELAFTPTSRHLVQLFFLRERARTASTWTSSPIEKPAPLRKVGVIGGGVMGAGIAQWCATQGFSVALKEVNESFLEQGMNRIRGLFDDSVRKRAISEADARTKLASIQPTIDWKPFADVDLVIEAATEKQDLKQAIFRELTEKLPGQVLLATNTSSLRVDSLTGSVSGPERVVGLHFFNPVHRMQLVEIVTTKRTSDQHIGSLVEFVKKLGKTPIVCADSPGFVVNRILFPYLDEAVRVVCEGVSPQRVDRVIEDFGMPMGPLEMLDQVGLDVAAHVADSMAGANPQPSPTPERLKQMVATGHLGRKSDQGFYKYDQGKKQKSEPQNPPASSTSSISDAEIEQRLVLRLVNEAAKVASEGIVVDPKMIDLAMVLGTGFAPQTGGPLSYAEQTGIPQILQSLENWERTAGVRFAPAAWWSRQLATAPQ